MADWLIGKFPFFNWGADMATETEAAAPDDERPDLAGEEIPETTADVDPVEPAEVEEFQATPSSPSEVVDPAPPVLDPDAPDGAETEGHPGIDALHPDPEAEAEPESKKKWYIIKVTSGREESIKAAIERKIKIEGLEEYFGQVYIPVEKVTEVKKVRETKNGERITKEKRVVKAKKKFPGYLMTNLEYNDDVLYVFRETSGVSEFIGAAPGKVPLPMLDLDVTRMLDDGTGNLPEDAKGGKVGGRKVVVKLDFEKGDKVRIRDGAFANMEGDIKEISTPKDSTETPKVTVVVTIFGRGVEMEFDYWQVDKV